QRRESRHRIGKSVGIASLLTRARSHYSLGPTNASAIRTDRGIPGTDWSEAGRGRSTQKGRTQREKQEFDHARRENQEQEGSHRSSIRAGLEGNPSLLRRAVRLWKRERETVSALWKRKARD